MRDLTPASRERLVAVLERMTRTDFEGEAVACAAALRRLREREGWAWSDLIRPAQSAPAAPDWRCQALALLRFPGLLTERDADFLRNVLARRAPPTEKQARWLAALVERFRAAGGDV